MGGSDGSYHWRCLACVTPTQIKNMEMKVGDVTKISGFDLLSPAEQKEVVSTIVSKGGTAVSTAGGFSAAAAPSTSSSTFSPASPAPKKAKVEESGMTKVVAKGGIPVDKMFPHAAKCHVYQEGGVVYDAMLNQTNLGANNNKFYVCQVLESDTGGKYYAWCRWGRIGAVGQNSCAETTSAAGAIGVFKTKFREKTGNAWEARKDFTPKSGKYTWVEMDYGADAVAAAASGAGAVKVTAVPTMTRDVIAEAHKAIDHAKFGRWDELYAMLDEHKELVNVRPDVREFSALHQAAWHGKTEVVERMLDHYGADPLPTTKFGKSIIEVAEEKGHTDLAKKLKGRQLAQVAGMATGPIPDSKLPKEVQRIVSLICDLKMMTQAMTEIGYDAKKMPLGNISKKMIKMGYEALQIISKELEKPAPSSAVMTDASSKFYTVIPHDFGFQHMSNFIINTPKKLADKLAMVSALDDIEIAHSLLASVTAGHENPMDVQYKKLKTDLTPLSPGCPDWLLVEEYVRNTHAKTHDKYTLKLKNLFSVEREGEAAKFAKYEKTHNRQLLWHGSRLTNWCGILSQGLRIAPPEAPVTGYMFGKGVYFADMSSKSANYCFTNKFKNTGLMVLAEVALGDENRLMAADFHASKLPPGKLSTKGCGKTAPDASKAKKWGDDVTVPCGPAKDISSEVPGSTLLYNEFIVYDVAQIRTRFLLELEFNYK